MLTSKFQLDYVLTRGGGQAVQGGLSPNFITASATGIFS